MRAAVVTAPAAEAEAEQPGLPAEEFIASIWLERRRWVREGRIKQPHPLRLAIGEGKLSHEALIAYVKNRYYFLANINRKDAQIIANCPISEARRTLMRKYIDEEGQDLAGGSLGPHYEMWLKVAEALGIPRDVMQSFGDVLPVYKYTVDAVFEFARNNSWLEGLAATYATEGQMWRRYTPKEEYHDVELPGEGKALEVYYGVPREALEFYRVHGDANDAHGDICEDILKRYCTTREQQRKAMNAARFRWDNHEARQDIIYEYFAR
ncbi:MAG TPA: iron-containing redox enzyme family protein [Chloroflexota bacterium]|nr:iron-containing redox enzyme family protein [Chloroflexota bacterium]